MQAVNVITINKSYHLEVITYDTLLCEIAANRFFFFLSLMQRRVDRIRWNDAWISKRGKKMVVKYRYPDRLDAKR